MEAEADSVKPKTLWGVPLHIVVLGIAILISVIFLGRLFRLIPDQKELACQPENRAVKQCTTDDFPEYVVTGPLAYIDVHNGLFLVIFTAALVWVGRNQWRVYEKQSEVMRDALSATKKAADAADEAAKTATKALSITERPLLFLDISPRVFDVFRYNCRMRTDQFHPFPTIPVSFKNYGRQPAIISTLRMGMRISSPPPSEDCASHYAIDWQVIEPQQHTGVYGCSVESPPINQAQLLQMKKSNTHVWFFGRLTYLDAFGGTYETPFLWLYNVFGNEFSPWYGEKGRNQHT